MDNRARADRVIRHHEHLGLLWHGHCGNDCAPYRKLQVNIPDTILFRNGHPVRWLFTATKPEVSGVILAKNRARLSMNHVLAALGRASSEHKLKKGDHFVCVVRTLVKNERFRTEFLREHQLLDLINNKHDMMRVASIQAYIGGGTSRKSTFSCEYKSQGISFGFKVTRVVNQRSGNLIGSESFMQQEYKRRIMSLLPEESKQRNVYVPEDEVQILSTQSDVNEMLQNITKQIVRFVEDTRKLRIENLRAEFICLESSAPILTHLSDVRFHGTPEAWWLPKRSKRVLHGKVLDEEQSMSFHVLGSHDLSNNETTIADDNVTEPSSMEKSLFMGDNAGIVEPLLSLQRNRAQRARLLETSGDFDPGLRILANGPPRSATWKCWGEYCDFGLGNDEMNSTRKVVLRSILAASIQRVEVEHAQGHVIEFRIKDRRANNTTMANIDSILLRHKIDSSRLYTDVPVCEACHEIYHMIDRENEGQWFRNSHLEPEKERDAFERTEELVDLENQKHGLRKLRQIPFARMAFPRAWRRVDDDDIPKGRPLRDVLRELSKLWSMHPTKIAGNNSFGMKSAPPPPPKEPPPKHLQGNTRKPIKPTGKIYLDFRTHSLYGKLSPQFQGESSSPPLLALRKVSRKM